VTISAMLGSILAMANSAAVLSNPIVAFALRAALGAYVIYMARGFYADPMGYFRKWMPRVPEYPLAKRIIRSLAAFCVWGGCFILVTAIATQIFGLHGLALAFALVTVAAVATYFLLPKNITPIFEDDSSDNTMRRHK
jgi:hypothetical protein